MKKEEQDYEIPKQFWEEVANKIEADYKYGPPHNWTKSERENFIKTFLPEIITKKPHNYKVENPGLSEATLRRIFITKESQGTNTTKDIFSWYLGYSDFFEYKAKSIKKAEKKPVFYYYLFALFALTGLGVSFFIFSSEKGEDAILKAELIDLVKAANKFEFNLGAQIQNYEQHLDSLEIYFSKEGHAYQSVLQYLKGNKEKNYILKSINVGSRQETLDARVTLLDTVNSIAHIETVEYWHYRWADELTNELRHVYEKINTQEYILSKSLDGKWQIKENIYRSDTAETTSFCEVNKIQQSVQNYCHDNPRLLDSLLEKNAIGQTVLLAKCICEEEERGKLINDLSDLGRAHNRRKTKLNHKKISTKVFLKNQQKVKQEIYEILEKNDLLCI
jgi:phage host-nuclease inhibitor protein Gam